MIRTASRHVVTGHVRDGARLYLTLTCGHRRLHNPRVPVPRVAHCTECPDRKEGEA